MNERIKRLRDESFEAHPSICIERAVLETEFYKENDNKYPMPVMRATLLGVISAPASKLVRTLAEPARSMAAVIKGYSEKEGTAA